ncbi:MAG: hypothetical protein ACK55Z_23235, partial [bacterium]
SAYIRAGVASRTGRIDIVWQTSAGVTISTTSGTNQTLTSGTFTRISTTATAPSNAAYAYLIITIQTVNIGEQFYVDSILFEQSSSVGTYIDFASAITVYDYEMARGITTTYR